MAVDRPTPTGQIAAMLTPFLLAAALAAADSTVFPVFNHERVAGSMVVTRAGDTVTVRYVVTDRNRGVRTFERIVSRDGRITSAEVRPVLPDEALGDPTTRLEVVGDSLRRWTPARTTTESLKRDAYLTIGFTPYDQMLLVKHVLHQPNRRATMAAGDTARVELLKELTVRTSRGSEKVKLIAFSRGTSTTPQLIWLDSSDGLFATEVGWFMTVKPGSESALPALRKAEIDYRDAQAEALNKRLMKPPSGA